MWLSVCEGCACGCECVRGVSVLGVRVPPECWSVKGARGADGVRVVSV